MNHEEEVVKWRDQQPDEHVVWVLLDSDKDIRGITSDWKVKERWDEENYGCESYFVDDEDAELFNGEKDCEWELDDEDQPFCGEPATYASGMPGLRTSYLCAEHAGMLEVPMPSDTLYRIDEFGNPLDAPPTPDADPEDLPFLPLPEPKQ
jgi:hypothetical protein